MAEWDTLWAKQLDTQKQSQEKEDKKKLAEERTAEAQEVLRNFDHLLADVLRTEHSDPWELLKDRTDYQRPRPTPPKISRSKPILPEIPPEPSHSDQRYKVKRMGLPKRPTILGEPQRSDSKYKTRLGILDKLVSSRRAKKGKQMEEFFARDYREWQLNKKKIITAHEKEVEEIKSIRCKEKEKAEALFQKDHNKWGNSKEEIIKDYDEEVINHERKVEQSSVMSHM